MARSQEEKSHTNGAQEIPKSVNRWNLCLPTVSLDRLSYRDKESEKAKGLEAPL